MQLFSFFFTSLIIILIITCSSCTSKSIEKKPITNKDLTIYYNGFPIPEEYGTGWERFDSFFQRDTNYVNEFNLTKLIPGIYKDGLPNSTFLTASKMIHREDLELHFYPLNQDTAEQFQYTHQYNCIYDPANYNYANIAYPNPCLGDSVKAKARLVLKNKSSETKTIHCRLFYQNTSYWFPTDLTIDSENRFFLQNYYGGSNSTAVQLKAGEEKEIFLEYLIGKDPKKNEWASKKFYGPARTGAYEFMLWTSEDAKDLLIQENIDYTKINPFAYYQEQLRNGNPIIADNIAYTDASHFKFITLMETFAGDNINKPGDIYVLSDRDEKPLCDTCTGYFKDVISNNWTSDDYFKGFIQKAPWIKADYGTRKENVRIDENGVYLKAPGSSASKKQKTWGEIKFGPSLLYGTMKVVAKFSQLRNEHTHTPTGIVHNLWLYEFNHPYADPIPNHPYAHLTNSKGKQPYEIDIEIWSKIYDENWGGGSAINYSIVDYMRDENALVKPGEAKEIDGNKVDRLNLVQLNYPGEELLGRDFFEDYHLYEIVWTPHDITYKVDGKEMAKIDWRMAKIPDEYSFLWIGSPIYQDGTYYAQSLIPFFPEDLITHIRYISIE